MQFSPFSSACLRILILAAMLPARADLVPITIRLPGSPVRRGPAGDSRSPVWAAADRFSFFVSDAPNLVADDWNGTGVDLFRRDRVTGSTLLVSASREPAEGANGPVVEFSVSADGQHVAFVSEASNLVAGDDNGAADVFVRDLESGTTRLVSWNLDRSGPGTGASFSPVLSADGRRVLYGTAAANVDPEAPPFATPRLCLQDLGSLDVTIVGNEPWLFEASADLDLVVFASEFPPEPRDLAPGSTPTVLKVWRAATGAAEWIQIPTWNYPEGRTVPFSHMALTPSGRHLALYIPGETGRDSLPVRGLWRLDLETGAGVRVWAPQQVLTPPQSDWLSMSADGRQMAFTVPPLFDTVFGEVRVWTEGQEPKPMEELIEPLPGQTASLRRVQSVRLSPQGDRLVYHTFERVPEAGVNADGPDRAYLRTLATGSTRILATGEVDLEATFDPSGEHLAFSSSDALGGSDIFTVDRTEAPPALVSVAMPSPEPLTSGASVARAVGLSDDGQRILFRSTARDLVTNATSGNLDAYLYDAATGSNRLMNVDRSGAAARLSWGPASVLSAAGNSVAFATTGTNFAETSPYRLNIYLRQVNEGVTMLASPQTFAAFQGPFAALEDPVQISGDGRRVGFRWLDRHATLPIFDSNLGGLLIQVWSAASLFQFVESRMSPDGWRIGCVQGDSAGWFDFRRINPVFGPFGSAGYVNVLRTPSQGDSMVVHRRSLAPGEGGVFEVRPEMGTRSLLVSEQEFGIASAGASAGGTVVVFTGRPLQRGNPPEPRQVYVRAVHGTGVERISTGWDGGPAHGDCRSPQISGDGRFVVFTSFASNLVAGDTNGFADVFVRDRFAGVTHCLSRRDDGVQENGHCAGAMISGDGTTVVFTTFGTRLIPGDDSSAPTLVRATVPQPAVLDEDGDRLPDVWEQDHLATLDQDGSGDSDEDGASHLDEYRARTAPADKASRLEMAGTQRLADGMEVHWHGHAGVRYQLEARDSLQGTVPWTTVGEPVVGYEGLVHQVVSLTGPGRYLRVRVIAAP